GFGEGLVNLLAELRRHRVAPDLLARAAAGPKETACAGVYARYCKELDRGHLYDAAGRLWRAAELLRTGLVEPFADLAAVFVDGFTDFSPAQQDLLEALAAHVGEVWITLPGEAGGDRAELFARPTATLQRLATLRPRLVFLPEEGGPGTEGRA